MDYAISYIKKKLFVKRLPGICLSLCIAKSKLKFFLVVLLHVNVASKFVQIEPLKALMQDAACLKM